MTLGCLKIQKMAPAFALGMLLASPACFLLLDLKNRPCPCAAGNTCCNEICIEDEITCTPSPEDHPDAGSFVADAGTPLIDGGDHGDGDSGTVVPPDAGTPLVDGGDPDGGPVLDAGSPVADGGPLQDGGGSPCDPNALPVNDPLHCGACNFTCASEICTAGVCAPYQLTHDAALDGGSRPRGSCYLAINETHIYYTSKEDNAIYRSPLEAFTGGTVVLDNAVQLTGKPDSPIQVTQTHLAATWNTDQGYNTIRLLALSGIPGNTPVNLPVNSLSQSASQGPVVAPEALFWSEGNAVRYVKPILGGSITAQEIDRGNAMRAIVLSGTDVFTAEIIAGAAPINIFKWSDATENPGGMEWDNLGQVPSSNEHLTSRAATANHVFWGTTETPSLYGAHLDVFPQSGEPWTLGETQFPVPDEAWWPHILAIAADEESVFFSMAYPNKWYLLQHALDGSTSAESARILYSTGTASRGIRSLVVHSGHLYFSVEIPGIPDLDIYRLEIPPSDS